MEYRKSNYTPRERIDDDLLLRILEDEEPINSTYGNSCRVNSHKRSTASSCTMSRMEYPGSDCGCKENCAKQNNLSGSSLAMVYSPDQEWRETYTEEDAMNHGTMFAELYKPFFHGCSGNCR